MSYVRHEKAARSDERSSSGPRDAAPLEVRGLAREHTAEALHTIVEIMRYARSDAVRLAAAEAILDRGWGRPAQAITGPEGTPFQVAAVAHAVKQFRERILGLTAGSGGAGERTGGAV